MIRKKLEKLIELLRLVLAGDFTERSKRHARGLLFDLLNIPSNK